MAIRTIADSVTPASGPPDNLAELNAALAQLGARIGHGSVVGAGAVVTASAVIPPEAWSWARQTIWSIYLTNL